MNMVKFHLTAILMFSLFGHSASSASENKIADASVPMTVSEVLAMDSSKARSDALERLKLWLESKGHKLVDVRKKQGYWSARFQSPEKVVSTGSNRGTITAITLPDEYKRVVVGRLTGAIESYVRNTNEDVTEWIRAELREVSIGKFVLSFQLDHGSGLLIAVLGDMAGDGFHSELFVLDKAVKLARRLRGYAVIGTKKEATEVASAPDVFVRESNRVTRFALVGDKVKFQRKDGWDFEDDPVMWPGPSLWSEGKVTVWDRKSGDFHSPYSLKNPSEPDTFSKHDRSLRVLSSVGESFEILGKELRCRGSLPKGEPIVECAWISSSKIFVGTLTGRVFIVRIVHTGRSKTSCSIVESQHCQTGRITSLQMIRDSDSGNTLVLSASKDGSVVAYDSVSGAGLIRWSASAGDAVTGLAHNEACFGFCTRAGEASIVRIKASKK